jgi:hypothetical protein
MNLFDKKQLTSNRSKTDRKMFKAVYKLINKIISPEGEEPNGQCTIILAGAEALYLQKGMRMNNEEWMLPFDINEQLELKSNYGDKVKNIFKNKHKDFSFFNINECRSDLSSGLDFTVNNMKEFKHLDPRQKWIFASFLEENPNELPNIILYVVLDHDHNDDWFDTYEAEELFPKLRVWGYDKKNIHVVWPKNGFYDRKKYHSLGLIEDGDNAKSITESAMNGAACFSFDGDPDAKATDLMDGYFIVVPDTKKMDKYIVTKERGKPFKK